MVLGCVNRTELVSRGQTLSPRRLLIGDYKRRATRVWSRSQHLNETVPPAVGGC